MGFAAPKGVPEYLPPESATYLAVRDALVRPAVPRLAVAACLVGVLPVARAERARRPAARARGAAAVPA